MEQQQRDFIADRLMATAGKLRELPDEAFHYANFVQKQDDHGCGTVCCVAGWYPKWFPMAGLEWQKKATGAQALLETLELMTNGENPGLLVSSVLGIKPKGGFKNVQRHSEIIAQMREKLSEYHLVDDDMINTLFFGQRHWDIAHNAEHGMDSNREEVLKVFEGVVKDIRAGKLDAHLLECSVETPGIKDTAEV